MSTSVRNADILFNDNTTQRTSGDTLTILSSWSRTTSGTENYVKSGGATGDTIIAVVVGGGGSGARSTISSGYTYNSPEDPGTLYYYAPATGGGGGGGVAVIGMPYEDCPASVSVTVGAGGNSISSSSSYGNSGGDSSFGPYAIATGGQGGYRQQVTWNSYLLRGALGGSAFFGASSDMVVATLNAGQEYSGSSIVDPGYRNGGSARSIAYATGGGFNPSTYESLIPWGYTGGGGAVLFLDSGTSTGPLQTQCSVGGLGRIFGDGGTAATTTTSNAAAGAAPGGGGGAVIGSGISGAGGTGAVYVYLVAGFVPASSILSRVANRKFTTAR